MKYDVDYFIRKFEATHEDSWCVEKYESEGKHCAMGHCGARNGFVETKETLALEKILGWVLHINDGERPEYQQPTPKQRILAALRDIKKMQQPKKPIEQFQAITFERVMEEEKVSVN